MSDGGTIGGLPITQYQLGPRDDSHLVKPAASSFGRSVEVVESPKNYVKLDINSQGFKKARAYFNKLMAERQVAHASEVKKQLPNPEAKSTQPVITTATLQPQSAVAVQEGVFASELTVEPETQKFTSSGVEPENPFLKSDGKTLKSTERTQASGKRRLSFESAANKIKSLNATSRAFGNQKALSDDVLIGFDKVAGYENQGIPGSYLKKTQEVANEENVLIAIRPVEKICRTLIEEGSASKGLKIKGKSANWGPQAGYIPVDQAYSKLATASADKIAGYNAKNQKTIFEKQDAVQEHLNISSTRIDELKDLGMLGKVEDISPAEGYEKGVAFESSPKGGDVHRFEAHQRPDGMWDVFTFSQGGREPLMVIPVTADFDLLFVHSRYEDVDFGQQDRQHGFDAELGIVSDRKKQVIDALNTKFARGENRNMVHHGADTENPVTDMAANLPATVFIPDAMLGKMGIYTESPIMVKTKQELARLYRVMRDAGIRVETNELWDELSKVKLESFNRKVDFFENLGKGRERD